MKRLMIVVCLLLIPPINAASAQAPSNGDPILIGAGDIAACSSPGDEQTAKLILPFLTQRNVTVFTAGDNAYEFGTPLEFAACYAPSWGQFRKFTRPSPGNHDYVTPMALGYFNYFGKQAGTSDRGYYSYDLGAWHIISLDSDQDTRIVGEEGKWLQADLIAHQGVCTLAYWHHPIFSTDPSTDTNPRVRELWRLLYQYRASVIVNGHIHYYERFAPQTPDGQADPKNGIREFIVGTGGAFLNSKVGAHKAPNSEVVSNATWGVIKFTLHQHSYDWEFIPVPGGKFHDAGSAPCVPAQLTF